MPIVKIFGENCKILKIKQIMLLEPLIATQPADMTILLMLLILILTTLQNQTKLFIFREIST